MSAQRRAGHLVSIAGALVALAPWLELAGYGPSWPGSGVPMGLALGAALAILGAGIVRGAVRFAAWAGTLIVGQAVALQLVRCGPLVRYQHLPPVQALGAPAFQPWLTLAAAQGLVAVLAFWRQRRRIAELMSRAAGRGAWAGAAAVLALSAATVSPAPAVYLGELVAASLLVAVQAATLLVALAAAPEDLLAGLRARLAALGRSTGTEAESWSRRIVLGASLAVTLAAAGLNLSVYQSHPHVPDEVAYLLQARQLAQGSLTSPAPPVPAAFEIYLMDVDGGQRYPVPSPGWPAILSLGILVGLPWLVNPLLAGLSVWLTFRLLTALYDRRLGLLAALLVALSPWHLFLGMSWMTHTSALAASLGAALCLVRCGRGGSVGWCALAGLLVGVVAASRPLDGVLVAIALTPLVVGGGVGARAKLRRFAACAAGGSLVGALLLAYNAQLTGDPLRMPIQRYLDRYFAPGANDYGFGANRGMGWALDPNPGHSPFDALVNSDLNFFAMNVELFGWSVGSLGLAALFVLSTRPRRVDLGLLLAAAWVYVGYFFYYFSGGPDFGARYWYLMIVPLTALTARGILEAGERLGGRDPLAGPDARPLLAAMLLSLSALVTFVPWRAVDKYWHYRGMRADVREMARDYGFGRSLVLVRGAGHPDYASAAIYNPLDLRAPAPIYAWDRSPEVRTAVLAAYRDRPVWLLDGPTETGDGFAVAAGPIPADELLQQMSCAEENPP